MWFSSFHKKSPFRDFKIWDGRTTLAAPRVKRQFRVLLHVALPQSQKRSSLRSACAEPIKSLRFFTSRPYLQNKKRIRKIPILFLSGMEGLEPPNAWTKTRCLTTWRHPNIVPAGRRKTAQLLLRLPRSVAPGKAAFVWGE